MPSDQTPPRSPSPLEDPAAQADALRLLGEVEGVVREIVLRAAREGVIVDCDVNVDADRSLADVLDALDAHGPSERARLRPPLSGHGRAFFERIKEEIAPPLLRLATILRVRLPGFANAMIALQGADPFHLYWSPRIDGIEESVGEFFEAGTGAIQSDAAQFLRARRAWAALAGSTGPREFRVHLRETESGDDWSRKVSAENPTDAVRLMLEVARELDLLSGHWREGDQSRPWRGRALILLQEQLGRLLIVETLGPVGLR